MWNQVTYLVHHMKLNLFNYLFIIITKNTDKYKKIDYEF